MIPSIHVFNADFNSLIGWARRLNDILGALQLCLVFRWGALEVKRARYVHSRCGKDDLWS